MKILNKKIYNKGMMEIQLNKVINQKLEALVDFILEKNSNANKNLINHKIDKLFFRVPTKLGSKSPKIIDSIIKQKQIIKVVKSPFLNYILVPELSNHKFDDLKKNKFVMDIELQCIIGIENLKGEIQPLTKELIEVCHKYKLKFRVPLNLNNDDIDDDIVINNEIHGLGLNYAESEDEENEE
jgi:hypothetical protein